MATPDDLRARVRAQYPAWAWLLEMPEVGELLLEAVNPDSGFDDATLQSRLMATDWWKSHSSAMRQWDTLASTDPATADQQRFHARSRAQMRATQLGVTGAEANKWVYEIAEMSLRMGWTAEQEAIYTQRILLEQVGQRDGAGEIGSHENQAKALAARYMIPMSDQAATATAEAILKGDKTWDGIIAEFTNQAKALYPHLSDMMDQGLTPAEIAEPYRQIAAQTLEVAPDQVQMTDPKFLRALGGAGKDAMSLSDWQTHLRTDTTYGWQNTKTAHDQAMNMANSLMRSMGMIR